MLKLRLIGTSDYSVLDGEQRIGRIRFADERIASPTNACRASGTPARRKAQLGKLQPPARGAGGVYLLRF
jgi:hypothetical protein